MNEIPHVDKTRVVFPERLNESLRAHSLVVVFCKYVHEWEANMHECVSLIITAGFFLLPILVNILILIKKPTFFGETTEKRETVVPLSIVLGASIIGGGWVAGMQYLGKTTQVIEHWTERGRHTPFRGTKEAPIPATMIHDRMTGQVTFVGVTNDLQTWNQRYWGNVGKVRFQRHKEPFVVVFENNSHFQKFSWILGNPHASGDLEIRIPEDMVLSNL
jgi:hypothetical protein